MTDDISSPTDRNIRLRDARGFGEAVERLRLDRGLDRAQFADLAGLSTKTLVAVEKGSRDRRQQSTLIRLAQALDISYEDMMRRAGELAPEPAGADASPSSWRDRIGRPAVLAALPLLVGVLIAAVVWTRGDPTAPLPVFAVESDRLVARHPMTGELAWRLETRSSVRLARTLPHDDTRLLVGLGLEATDAGWCMLVDRRTGEVRWRYRPDPRFAAELFDDPDLAVNGGFSVYGACFPDLDGDGTPEIMVNFMHNLWYPSVVCQLTHDGGLVASYWNRGRIYEPLIADLDDDGKDEVVWTATNNVPAYQGASVLLLDDECRRGASFDPVSGGRTDWPDSARVRLVIPAWERPFMDHLKAPRLKATFPRIRRDAQGIPHLQINVSADDNYAAIVTLDAELRPLAAAPSDQLQLELASWLADTRAAGAPAVQTWLAAWLADAVRFEAGHWPPRQRGRATQTTKSR